MQAMQVTFRCDPLLQDNLPRPQPAQQALPDWVRAMRPKAFSPLHGRDIRTIKQCPPFIDAMTHGFVILLPCDVRVERGVFSWDWDLPEPGIDGHPRAPLSFHVPEQLGGTPLHSEAVALKFNSFWTIELPPGWSLLAMHPANRWDLPFRTLSGLVDADRFHDVGINFPALWTDAEFDGVLPKGTPVAQCCPVPRAELELSFGTIDAEGAGRYEKLAAEVLTTPGVYRKRFRAPRERGGQS
ncbi:hypothetical protein [Cupriavidus basilensis]|nr:hypothetical protein [Cupriavidus basilensis]